MKRPVHSIWFTTDKFHDIDLTTGWPVAIFDKSRHHPNCWPNALAIGQLCADFKSSVQPIAFGRFGSRMVMHASAFDSRPRSTSWPPRSDPRSRQARSLAQSIDQRNSALEPVDVRARREQRHRRPQRHQEPSRAPRCLLAHPGQWQEPVHGFLQPKDPT